MNWPAFALITYGFVMALLLAAFILRNLRDTKGRYQRILEEKEQKLAAMQLNLEETLEALEERAIALEAGLNASPKRNDAEALEQRILDIQRGLTSLQSRVLRLEQRTALYAPAEPQASGADTSGESHAHAAITAAQQASVAFDALAESQAYAASAVAAEPRESRPANNVFVEQPLSAPRGASGTFMPEAEKAPVKLPRQEDKTASAAKNLRERTLELLQSGMSIAEICKQTGQSKTEITLLYNQWKKSQNRRDTQKLIDSTY